MKEHENASKWDVLSLSLVLNFVPEPRERGMGILLASISFTSHIFREDAAVGSFVSRRCTYASGPLVRDGRYRSGLALVGNWLLIVWCSSPCLVCKIHDTSRSVILRA